MVLTWLYAAGGQSILVVALWHTTYNFTSATSAMDGLAAAVTSTAGMVVAVMIAIIQVRRGRPVTRTDARRNHPRGSTLHPWRTGTPRTKGSSRSPRWDSTNS